MSNDYNNIINEITNNNTKSQFVKLLYDRTSVIFLYGAGQLGERYYTILRENGFTVKGYIVDQEYVQNTKSDYYVTTLDNAIETYKSNIVVIVTICNSNFNFKTFTEVNKNITFYHFSLLNYFLNSMFGDYYFFSDFEVLKENEHKILNVLSILNSEDSKKEFIKHLNFRKSLDFELLKPKLNKLYYPDFLHNKLNSDFHFIDCGGYIGDSLMLFEIQYNLKFEKITVFEPDKSNFKNLLSNIKNITNSREHLKIQAINKAISDSNKKIRFNNTATEGSKISFDGNYFVETVCLDQYISKPNTFIKFDIEGEELNAIKGMKNAIKKYKPILAISAYHNPSDFWEIPLLIKYLNPDYKIELVLEGLDGMGLVYYMY